MIPNPDLPVGTWVTYRYKGADTLARVVDLKELSGRFKGEHGLEHGPVPAVGTEVVRVVFKGEQPQRRETLIYDGITDQAFKFRKKK